MNLLYWTPFFFPDTGGVETISRIALARFKALGYNTTVVTSVGRAGGGPVSVVDGIPIHRYPLQQAFRSGNHRELLKIAGEISRLKRRFEPDIVHVNLSDPSVVLHMMTNSDTVPTLVALHNEWTGISNPLMKSNLIHKVLMGADWVTSVSRSSLAKVHEFFPELGSRSSVEHNGIDTERFDPGLTPAATPTALYCGRLIPEKGVDRVIRAMNQVVEHLPDATLVVAGDGPERRNLEALVEQSGLNRSVRFEGTVPPVVVARLMGECRAVLMASRSHETRSEGLPMVLLEAGAMARPVVAAPDGGTAEVVEHGKTGLLVEGDDAGAFASAILALLRDPALVERLGRAARRRIEKHFSLDDYVGRYHGLYRQLAAHEPTP